MRASSLPVVGFGYESTGAPSVDELVNRLSPLVDHCLEAFGPERCMFASNFPVDRVSVSYDTLVRAMAEITARYGEVAQTLIFRDVAAAFYRL